MDCSKIYIYTDFFKDFNGSEKILKKPAAQGDSYSYISFQSEKGEMGFFSSDIGKMICDNIYAECICVDTKKRKISLYEDGGASSILIRPKGNVLIDLVETYRGYILDMKKYEVIKRKRFVERPSSHIFDEVFLEEKWSGFFYDFIMENSWYVLEKNRSGEHGQISFESYTRNQEILDSDLKSFCCGSSEFVYVDSFLKIPFD
ncbi:hypothetical protein [Pseudomonas mangiferae]|uniref:Uncharacterized protein n=1 Tax=Pseudomonas mangiferae TaxID=2593654 RepID=A0A553GTL8_9PSED|nr:hypothetical protein [Pseudomonas mangiferae]TRX72847.1 hypothetical protein FM069_20740 [Pseudomonas mangiferae]